MYLADFCTCIQTDRYASVVKTMETLGARVVFPLEDPPSPDMLVYESETIHSVSCQ